MKFKESSLAHRYLDGLPSGIEVGGSAHNPFNIRNSVCLNVDRYPHPLPDGTITVFKQAEINVLASDPVTPGEPLPVDIVAPGDAIPLPDESQGYVLSSHVLEHFFDPIAALLEWHRLVKTGGYILAIVPARDALEADKLRPLSTIDEVAAHHTGPKPANADDDVHWFVWSEKLLGDVVAWINANTGARLSVVEPIGVDDKVGNGLLLLVRKEQPGATVSTPRGDVRQAKRDYLTAFADGKPASQDPRAAFDAYTAAIGVKPNADAVKTLALCGDMGTACYRLNPPFLELARDPRFDVRVTNSAVKENIEWADVIFLQRVVARTKPPIEDVVAKVRATRGTRLIHDNDDWLHGIPDANPAGQAVLEQGQVGVLEKMLSVCDVATFSTDYLAKLYAPMVKSGRTAVLPNCIDLDAWDMFEPPPMAKNPDAVVVGWSGSPTHYADLKVVEPAILELMKHYPNVWFFRCGASGPDAQRVEYTDKSGQKRSAFVPGDAIGRLPANRRFVLEFEPHSHTIGKYIRCFDVGIAPLVPDNFARAKSNLKTLEYSVCSVPAVATDCEPYNYDRERCPTILIKDNDLLGWYRALETLVVDRDFRVEMGRRARDYVVKQHSIGDHVSKWADLILSLGDEARRERAERAAA